MKFLSSEKLSEHKYKTPEGYLICTDAILARTGKQTYRRSEVFADAKDDNTEIEIDRKPDEVFSAATLASFENKPITVEHPDEDVNSRNYQQHSVGFVRDVKKGSVNGQDVMLGTLVITDEKTIEEIENGEHTDLSCGYDCDIIDEANPQQRNIRGNHVALCQEGRAGIAHIVDSIKAKLVGDSIESDFEDITNMSDARIILKRYGIELTKKDDRNYVLSKNGQNYTFYVLSNPNEVRKDLARAVHKLVDSNKVKDVDSFTYYKGFVFDKGDSNAPTFEGFDSNNMTVQKIKDYNLWIVYKKNGSHADLYNLVKGNEDGFTVMVEPGKITIAKLHKYSYINPILVKAAKELEHTNNVVFNDSINDGYYWNDIRRVCIQNNWYTHGTNAEYDNMFENARTGKWNAEQIAKDIYEHSSLSVNYQDVLNAIKKLNPNAVTDSVTNDSLKTYQVRTTKDSVEYIQLVKAKSLTDVINKMRK